MLNYIEYLHTPTKIAVILVGVFLITQVIGELLEFKGKVVPEFLKIRKFFARKKRERKALSSITGLLDEYSQMSKTIVDTQNLLSEVNKHYSEDNITMRNDWIESVNKYIEYDKKKRDEQDKLMRELNEKLDKNNADTLSLLIDNKRNTIINFAQCVIDDKYLVTREQFERIFKLYKEYEDIITENGLTNGEIDIAYRIITEAYEKHMKTHSFVEDVRNYNN